MTRFVATSPRVGKECESLILTEQVVYWALSLVWCASYENQLKSPPRYLIKMPRFAAQSPRVAEECDSLPFPLCWTVPIESKRERRVKTSAVEGIL
ncbi:hypothetical protein TNCV_2906821 [Trichonephila clavipes]|nr:hypothetical protein TNCV_2906821 [Trichonephila clavipes]